MKRIIKPISFLSLIIILTCCSASKYTVSEKGDVAKIKLKDGRQLDAELIAIEDSTIILSLVSSNSSNPSLLISISTNKLKSITIDGYDGDGWISGVLIFQALPVVLLGIAASQVKGTDVTLVTLISAIPAAITAMLFAASDRTNPHWNDTMSLSELNKLKIYSRHPGKFTFDKQQIILKDYGQKDIKEF